MALNTVLMVRLDLYSLLRLTNYYDRLYCDLLMTCEPISTINKTGKIGNSLEYITFFQFRRVRARLWLPKTMLRVVVLFFASLQICTNFNFKTIAWAKYESSNMDFAKKTFLSAPANRQLLAQRAMRLVTRIDISTCRCVNIFTVGKPFMKWTYRIALKNFCV